MLLGREDMTDGHGRAAANAVEVDEPPDHGLSGGPVSGRELAEQLTGRARLDWHLGACVELVARTDGLLSHIFDARLRGELERIRCIALVDLGRFGEAAARLQAACECALPGLPGGEQLTWVRAEAALWSGRPGEALELAEQFCRASPEDPAIAFGEVTRAWARLELGSFPGPVASAHDHPTLLAVPEETVALQLVHAGDSRTAANHFDRAADRWSGYHRRGELRCRWAAGEALRSAGDLPAAVQRLEAVEVRAEQLSFAPLLARVRLALRRSGKRRSATRSVGRDGLSGREREVLEMAALGYTNGQIAAQLGVSRRTVHAQVRSAAAKLGAASRGQAAALAATAKLRAGPSCMVNAEYVADVLERSVRWPPGDDQHHASNGDRERRGSARRSVISEQEAALLRLLLTGMTLGETARTLHLSRRTADRRLASARRALGADNTTQALVIARHGSLPVDLDQGLTSTCGPSPLVCAQAFR